EIPDPQRVADLSFRQVVQSLARRGPYVEPPQIDWEDLPDADDDEGLDPAFEPLPPLHVLPVEETDAADGEGQDSQASRTIEVTRGELDAIEADAALLRRAYVNSEINGKEAAALHHVLKFLEGLFAQR